MPDMGARVAGSFRDPSGFVFTDGGRIYRQINRAYQDHYLQLMSSGLYDKLVGDGLLIPHTEVGTQLAATADAYKVIEPVRIPFVSYPYEWCFSQLKQAALLTLRLQRTALDFGMSLKDASAYNVQFHEGRPVLIDSLSFEAYEEGKPWVAYRQFCQHFYAPLALMAQADVRLHQLLRANLDGIPLDMASRLLPARTWFSFPSLSHIHLHARAQKHWADGTSRSDRGGMGRTSFLGLVDSLRSGIEKLRWQPGGTEWHDYYAIQGYTSEAMEHKQGLVADMLNRIVPRPKTAWDLGANTGRFSRIASDIGVFTVSVDSDPSAVESSYLESLEKREANILPLVVDLANPSPGLGWENRERSSLLARGPADVVFALALLHHLAISENLPFRDIASFLHQACSVLIIEYVPKEDAQVQRLLAHRKDIFTEYTQESFEEQFGEFFTIQDSVAIVGTNRTLYQMARRGT
ncbi:SAM-dependent methyltransferase [Chloroflexota bacterium]